MSQLYSLQVEKHCISGLLRNFKIFADIDFFVRDDDFYLMVHRVIYSVIKQLIISGQTLDKVIIAQKIEALKIRLEDNVSIFDYVESLSYVKINNQATIEAFKILSKLRILRDISASAVNVKEYIDENTEKPLIEIISACDSIYSKIAGFTNPYKNQFEDITTNLQETMEEWSKIPVDDRKFMEGPFPTINRIYGSLLRPSNVTLICSRSAGGKTALSMYYNIYAAYKYKMPVLWMDFGEMSPNELKVRAAMVLSNGKIPYWAIEKGQWKSCSEWLQIGNEAWSRAKNLHIHYVDVSRMNVLEVLSTARRFSYGKVGRDNPFLWVYDYLKPLDTSDFNTPEWKQMGHFIQDIKTFIESEVQVNFWAALQSNRKGIITNRSSGDIEDSEDIFAMSDRLLQQSSHSFILRYKTLDELAAETLKFGNMKMINVKARFLGEEPSGHFKMVKIGKRMMRNYANLNFDSFCFTDCGDVNQMISILKEKFYPVADKQEENGKENAI